MTSANAFPVSATTAAYLCCRPATALQMGEHRHALRRYATALRLPPPILFRESGNLPAHDRPELDRLIALVADKVFSVVFFSVPWPSCPNGAPSHYVRQQLTAQKCLVLDVPATRHCAARTPARGEAQ
ncbi:hypothetical protein OH805_38080 [Streptomyces sp. NBC_00879]|uniref:hypothetical protein n=1 Tax=Streptomyces sp. NBC_00879 TaxID=2975855 RepID=UPI003864ADD9|nr:hypothetical protein OH805_38080 [Streptomyces sp. NBC_00879]